MGLVAVLSQEALSEVPGGYNSRRHGFIDANNIRATRTGLFMRRERRGAHAAKVSSTCAPGCSRLHTMV